MIIAIVVNIIGTDDGQDHVITVNGMAGRKNEGNEHTGAKRITACVLSVGGNKKSDLARSDVPRRQNLGLLQERYDRDKISTQAMN